MAVNGQHTLSAYPVPIGYGAGSQSLSECCYVGKYPLPLLRIELGFLSHPVSILLELSWIFIMNPAE